MMFIEIEGTRDQVKAARGIAGVEFPRGGEDLGGGRRRITVYVTRKEAIAEIEARGLTVRIVVDEDESQRRIEVEQQQIRRAQDAGAVATPPPDDSDKGSDPKGTA